jgi:hypothetical protein
MIVYANSDSYGVCSTGKTYVDFIGQAFDASTVNRGLSGSCNRRIIRTTIRDLLDLKKENKDILAIIGLAHTNRFEFWGEDPVNNDGHFQSFQPGSVVPNLAKHLHKGWIENYNDESANINLFLDLILLTKFFKSYDINYLIWQGSMSLKSSDFDAAFIKNFYVEVKADSKILDMFNFSFSKYCSIMKGYIPYDSNLYGIHGHHCEQAHKDFAEYLLENYLNDI